MKATTTILAGLRGMAVAAAILVLAGGAACSGNGQGRIHVPPQDTAREQFAVAQESESRARGVLNLADRKPFLQNAIMAYEMVVNRFPMDDRYAPAALVIIAGLNMELDNIDQAVLQYREALQKYPNDREVRVTALHGLAKALDVKKQPAEAETYYRMVVDEFGSDTTDPQIQRLVAESYRRLRTIQILKE